MILRFRATIRKDVNDNYFIAIPMENISPLKLREKNVYEFVVDTTPIYNVGKQK